MPAIKLSIPWLVSCSQSTLYRDTRIGYKVCTRTAKTAPYSPRTVTALWLKYQDPARMLRRVTLTKLYRRAVRDALSALNYLWLFYNGLWHSRILWGLIEKEEKGLPRPSRTALAYSLRRFCIIIIYKTGPWSESASACQSIPSYQRRPNKPVNAMLNFQ